MNKILISENALTKWYWLGSIEFLATLKCLIIICCFLPAEFWKKYAEVSELTGHVRTSGFYGIGYEIFSINNRKWLYNFYKSTNSFTYSSWDPQESLDQSLDLMRFSLRHPPLPQAMHTLCIKQT
jgi:hypothetical protein